MPVAAISKQVAWLIIGLFFWLPAQTAAQEPKPSQVKTLVKAAVRYAMAQGLEATIRTVDDPTGPFSRGPLRIFILDTAGGVLLADPLRSRMVGSYVRDLKDSKGKRYYRAMEKIAKENGSGWSDHFIIPPGGKWADIEAVYVEAIPGSEIIFGCGLFDMDAATAQAQSRK